MHETRHKRNTRLVLTVIVAFSICGFQPAQAGELKLGENAPAAELVTLDGQHISTHGLKGHTVILTFWATWCEPCRKELPVLSHYAAAHKANGLKVLGFCLDETEDMDKVRAVARQLSFPVGLLTQSSAPGYGRMWRIPVSFVIDSKGALRYDGWQDSAPAWTETSLKRVVGPLLANAIGQK